MKKSFSETFRGILLPFLKMGVAFLEILVFIVMISGKMGLI